MTEKYFFLEIPLLYKCNQQCYYCNIWKLKNVDKEINLNYLNWILNQYPKNLLIELTGGEPGLLDKNYLLKLIEFLKKHSHVKKIQLNSNGLIRKKYPDLIQYFDYYEHSILEFQNKNIIWFYDDIKFINQQNAYTVIVLVENTLKSLINNFDYWYSQNLFDNNIFFKVANFKSKYISPVNLLKQLDKLFEKYLIYERKNILTNIKQIYYISQKYCALISYSPVLNLLDNKIYHCGLNYELSHKKEITEQNIKLHYQGKLWINEKIDYCKNCNVPLNNRKIFIDNFLRNIYYNLIIRK